MRLPFLSSWFGKRETELELPHQAFASRVASKIERMSDQEVKKYASVIIKRIAEYQSQLRSFQLYTGRSPHWTLEPAAAYEALALGHAVRIRLGPEFCFGRPVWGSSRVEAATLHSLRELVSWWCSLPRLDFSLSPVGAWEHTNNPNYLPVSDQILGNLKPSVPYFDAKASS